LHSRENAGKIIQELGAGGSHLLGRLGLGGLRFEAHPGDGDFHLQNYQNKINWKYGSSNRAPALQA
jgi:hypothetical protein